MVPVNGAELVKLPFAEKDGAAEKPSDAEAGGQSADCVAMGKHDAVAGANDGLRIDLIGETDTGTEVLVVVVDWRGAVAGVGAMCQ